MHLPWPGCRVAVHSTPDILPLVYRVEWRKGRRTRYRDTIHPLQRTYARRYSTAGRREDRSVELQGSSYSQADVWGNPFQVTERFDENGRRSFGVYSYGRDGVSSTEGNDLDDINSWTENPVAYYQTEAKRESLIYWLSCTFALVGIIYAVLYVLLRTSNQQNRALNTKPR